MALSAWKTTWFYNHGRQGWTETLYYLVGGASFDDASGAAVAFGNDRLALLGKGPVLVAQRVEKLVYTSDPFGPRLPPGPNPSLISYTLSGRGTDATWKNSPVKAANDAALVELATGDGLDRREWPMHGIPVAAYKGWGDVNGLQTLTDDYITDLKHFFQKWSFRTTDLGPGTSPWGIRARANRGSPTRFSPVLNIRTIPPDPHFQIQVTTNPAIVLGSVIHVRLATECHTRGINGQATVTAIDPAAGGKNWLTLNKIQCCKGVVDYDGKAKYELLAFTFKPLSYFSVERYAARKVGRPFGGSRGRAPKRVCCSL